MAVSDVAGGRVYHLWNSS